MKNELTPQISAMYLGQKCTVTGKDAPILYTYYGDGESVTITPNFLQEIANGRCEVILHLRRLESLTEAEARELYAGNDKETVKDLHWWITKRSPNEVSFNPTAWLYLLSLGIDLFQGIESGWAKPLETNEQ